MSFRIDIGTGKEWDSLRKSFATNDSLQRALPDISIAILKLHSTLETRVSDLFNMPSKLSSVMIGNSVKPAEVGKTFLRYNLQYRRKAIPLANFRPISVTKTIVRNAIPIIKANGSRGQILVNKARITKVQVRRGKTDNSTRNPQYFYYAKKKRILARNQQDTWNTLPELDMNNRIIKDSGERAPVRQIFGPSLMEVANRVFDKDRAVQKAYTQMQTDIITALLKGYN